MGYPTKYDPSHIVLIAHEVLPKICNQSSITKVKVYGLRKNKREEYSCSKGPYEFMVMAQSMNNLHQPHGEKLILPPPVCKIIITKN
jgi:hypothetical protein